MTVRSQLRRLRIAVAIVLLLALVTGLSGCVTTRRGEGMEKDIIALRVQLEALAQAQSANQRDVASVTENLNKELKGLQHVSQVNTASDHVELERMKDELRRLNGMMESLGYTSEQGVQQMRDALASLTLRVSVLEAKAGVTPPPEGTKTSAIPAKQEGKTEPTSKGTERAEPVAAAADPTNAKELFKKAKTLAGAQKGGDTVEARRLLALFLQKFPKDTDASKAQYWIGETYYREKKYAQAIREFQKVEEKYKNSPAAPDALFMIAESFSALGMKEDAKTFYEECVARYGKTPAAARAEKALKKL